MKCPKCRTFVYAKNNYCGDCGTRLPLSNMSGTNLVPCPVCKKRVLKQGLKNHIAGIAKTEKLNNFKKKPHYEMWIKSKKYD